MKQALKDYIATLSHHHKLSYEEEGLAYALLVHSALLAT